ncbi:MAG TPA: fibronectin type III-like domain-contianing protein, partial [Thiolinea sp.]|nr:fibronectin type III-like domain-contianing protein [Thiolinea sp.]
SAFSYSNLKLSSAAFKGELTVSVDITNSGSVAGKEVVQVYVSAPAVSMDKPSHELRAFTKTKLLQPNETQTLSFTLTERDLVSWSVETHGWLVDQGEYQVKIGASCVDVRAEAKFQVI